MVRFRHLRVAGLALLLTVVLCGGAHAHAVLLDSSPPADATLAEAPARIMLRFNEPVRPVRVLLLRGEDGTGIELGSPEAANTTLHVALPRPCRPEAMS
jgi:copper transport protein